mgnify:CR=1 FL=1
MLELCIPIIYGSPKVATYHRKAMELTTNFVTIQKADEAVEGKLNLVDCLEEEVKIDFGQPSAESGKAALAALERAMVDYRERLFDVLVTAPINKATIQGDGFHFPGHTEYIQERVGEGREALMILMNDVLRVALVTTHLPIRDVAQAITKEAVMQKIRIFHEALRKDFNVSNPRIAVLALNPHAGDGGLLGTEEKDIIRPALQEMVEGWRFLFRPLCGRRLFRKPYVRAFRRRVGHVSRPGIGTVQGTVHGGRGELYGRTAHRPYFSRPWYGLRYRRTGKGRRVILPPGGLCGIGCVPQPCPVTKKRMPILCASSITSVVTTRQTQTERSGRIT